MCLCVAVCGCVPEVLDCDLVLRIYDSIVTLMSRHLISRSYQATEIYVENINKMMNCCVGSGLAVG